MGINCYGNLIYGIDLLKDREDIETIEDVDNFIEKISDQLSYKDGDPLGVKWKYFGDYSRDCFRSVCVFIKDSDIESYGGMATELPIEVINSNKSTWDELIKAWCDRKNIEYQQPRWLLVSDYI